MSLKYRSLIGAQIACFIPAALGGIATSSSVSTWYTTLNKPSFNPPNYLFGPVWTVLYLMQGISLYLINTATTKDVVAKLIAQILFYFQLVLNLLWSIFFFGLKNPALGLIEIGLLDITVIFTIVAAFRVRKAAAYLLIPYLLWISFATYLNYSIFILNR